MVSGFSTSTGKPAAMHMVAPSACIWFGVASSTPSAAPDAIIWSRLDRQGTPSAAATSRAPGAGSTMQARIHAAGNADRFGMAPADHTRADDGEAGHLLDSATTRRTPAT